MFKKRNTGNKAIKIDIELQDINLQPSLHTNYSYKKFEPAVIDLQSIMINQNKHQPIIIENDQLLKCFEEIKNYKDLQQEENQKISSQPQQLKEMGIMIIQDSQQQLEYKIDLGDISPQAESDIQQDYQQELIRKTLTKQNYQNLTKKTDFKYHLQTQKDKTRQMIHKINQDKIKIKIQKDLIKKKQQLNQLNSQLRYLENRINSKDSQLNRKRQLSSQYKEKFDKVKQVVQFLYYYGDKVKQFNMDKILTQIQQEGYNIKGQENKDKEEEDEDQDPYVIYQDY